MKTKNMEKRIEEVEAIVPVVKKLAESSTLRHDKINSTFAALTSENNTLRAEINMLKTNDAVHDVMMGQFKEVITEIRGDFKQIQKDVKYTCDQILIKVDETRDSTLHTKGKEGGLMIAGKLLYATFGIVGILFTIAKALGK